MIFESKADDRTDLIVIDTVNERCYEDDVDASLVKVIDSSELYIKQITDLAVRVGIVANAIELEVYKS